MLNEGQVCSRDAMNIDIFKDIFSLKNLLEILSTLSNR